MSGPTKNLRREHRRSKRYREAPLEIHLVRPRDPWSEDRILPLAAEFHVQLTEPTFLATAVADTPPTR